MINDALSAQPVESGGNTAARETRVPRGRGTARRVRGSCHLTCSADVPPRRGLGRSHCARRRRSRADALERRRRDEGPVARGDGGLAGSRHSARGRHPPRARRDARRRRLPVRRARLRGGNGRAPGTSGAAARAAVSVRSGRPAGPHGRERGGEFPRARRAPTRLAGAGHGEDLESKDDNTFG